MADRVNYPVFESPLPVEANTLEAPEAGDQQGVSGSAPYMNPWGALRDQEPDDANFWTALQSEQPQL